MNTANITSVTKELCEPPHWNYFTEELSRAFRLTEKESKELYKSTVARIIADIMERLKPIANFEGGNRDVKEYDWH